MVISARERVTDFRGVSYCTCAGLNLRTGWEVKGTVQSRSFSIITRQRPVPTKTAGF